MKGCDFCVYYIDKSGVNISLCDNEDGAVKIAAKNLKRDIQTVFDCEGADNKNTIVIGTLGNITLPNEISKNSFCNEDGYIWECYRLQVVGSILYIIGTDRRGTIYGIYELCRMIGVSPWYYWADVPIQKLNSFTFNDGFVKTDYPAVKYRGIFLNDEEELEAWAKKHTADNTIGPQTYIHIYELLLRLGANYIWPAMHVNYFNENPENARLADEMGIVVGTTHCDMMLRSNQNEWNPWLKSKGYSSVEYDYSIEGRNREILNEYWKEGIEINRNYEASYTVGMRGIHDYGFTTRAIDKSDLTPEEKLAAKIRLLETVINNQRKILTDTLGREREQASMKLFIPYKEVLDLYDGGLNVPDDITLMWVDDNFGYMRRYPNEVERKRSGGHGLYYHSSYWAAPGMSYLFINSIPLAHTGNELKKCYESGIKKVWILNVGALKPLEIDTEYFLSYAWNVGKEEKILDADCFMENWYNENFTGGYGREIAEIYNGVCQITNVCKLEHMASDKFSQTAYGDEWKKRLEKLRNLFERANQIYINLNANERDAFYEMVLMKIHASYYINASFYYADKSRLMYDRGIMILADRYVELSREADDRKRQLIYYYNNKIQNGKWSGILTPEEFSPPPTALYPAGMPALISDNKEGFIEDNGYISIPADRFENSVTSKNSCWRIIKGIGRGGGNAVEAYNSELKPYEGDNPPYMEYGFYTHTEGEFLLEIYRFLTLNPTGKVRFALSFDGFEKTVVKSDITDEWRGKWRNAVLNDGEKLYVKIPYLEKGYHTLRIFMIDNYVTITKLVIYTESMKPSNQGPDFSFHTSYAGNLTRVTDLEKMLYNEQYVPLLPMLYAKRDFWSTNRLYVRSDERPNGIGKLKYQPDSLGRKNVFSEFGKGIIKENDGVLAIEAEWALENSENAYITQCADGSIWSHTQSESAGRSGLAMLVRGCNKLFEKGNDAPAMNYRILIQNGGLYHIWLLVKFDDDRSDSCYLALDGNVQDIEKQFSMGNMFTYSMKQRWNWQAVSDMELQIGEHTFSIQARKSGLRIDRVYLTTGDELPPSDDRWISSERAGNENV